MLGATRTQNINMHLGNEPRFMKPTSRACRQLLQSRPRSKTAFQSSVSISASSNLDVDVAIVGAGIIGVSTAMCLLRIEPQLTVALVENKELCAGATGAGQGYIWMIHRNPSSPAWKLATHSKSMWQSLLADSETVGVDQEAVEWTTNGSMLIATTEEESDSLQQRQILLQNAGINARFLDAGQTKEIERALNIPGEGAGLLVPDDSQISGRRAAATLLAACESHSDRFHKLFNEPCRALITEPSSGRVTGIETVNRTIKARRGVVIAAGAWTGPFLAEQLGNPAWKELVQPRRGHLLEVPRPEAMPVLKHGLMEMGYTKHYAGSASTSSSAADVTFTATTSISGSLLIGSSREFSGWDAEPVPQVIDSIMERAAMFLPGLYKVKPEDISVRVGLRPFSQTGPMIGPVPGADGLLVATGHEGSGLTLGPATAELLVDSIIGRPHRLTEDVIKAVRPQVPQANAAIGAPVSA